MNKVFCEFCLDLTDYTVKEEKANINIRGKDYFYNKKISYCSKCGKEINVNEILDENIKSIDIAYRKEEDIISIEDINKILVKYDIRKKPLSLLLGFGEITIIRYLDGDMPTKVYSNILKRVLLEPDYMNEMLEENKSKLTNLAYRNVKNKLESMCNVSKDIDIVIKYILSICEEVTPLALQKLLYYCQGFYKAFFNKFLFKEDCQAWVWGPVYADVYEKYKSYGCNLIENFDFSDIEFLDENKKILIDVIVNSFGFYTGKALAKMTHLETPWLITRNGISEDVKCCEIIDKDMIGEYFIKIKDKYNMLNISEIKKYSEEQFDKIFLI